MGDTRRTVPVDEIQRMLALIAEGRTNVEISQLMNLSVDTLKSRIRQLMLKHHARNRVQLVSIMRRTGQVPSVRPDVVEAELAARVGAWTGVEVPSSALADAYRAAFNVRTGYPSSVRHTIQRLRDEQPERLAALVVVLAALVPLDESPDVLLRWLRPVRSAADVDVDASDDAAGSDPSTDVEAVSDDHNNGAAATVDRWSSVT